jgi:hypothetical protein
VFRQFFCGPEFMGNNAKNACWRDLRASVTCFPHSFLAPDVPMFTEELSPPIPIPLCDLRPLLKLQSHGDLRAMQGQLIEETVGACIAEIIIKIPVTNLGKDLTCELAA